METETSGPPIEHRDKKPLRSELISQIALLAKMAEMRLKYPDQYQSIAAASEAYSHHSHNPNWVVSETPYPQLNADLHLLKRLEPLHLEPRLLDHLDPNLRTTRKLKALEIFDYCNSPAKMSARTGIPEMDALIFSQHARDSVAKTVTDLNRTAYGTEPLDQKMVDPDTFSRKFVIFITQPDMDLLDSRVVAGLAVADAKAALVAIDRSKHIIETPVSIGTKLDTQPGVLHSAIHEVAHLARLYQSEKLHYRFLNREDRFGRNLEEGSDELLTLAATRHVWDQEMPIFTPSKYLEAANRIKNGLIPKLVTSIQAQKTDLEDLPVPDPDSARLTEIITARFLLGDYELLRRGTAAWSRDRDLGTSLSAKLSPHPRPWHEAIELLEHPDVFGYSDYIINDFYTPGGQDEEGQTLWADLDLRGRDFVPLPVYRHHEHQFICFKPEYAYETYDRSTKTWSPVPSDRIPFRIDMYLRINYLDVHSDLKKPAAKIA